MGVRRRSREAALKILYQADLLGAEDPGALIENHFAPEEAESVQRAFVEKLVRGVLERRGEIDARLAGMLDNWPVERLGYIERAILRMGVYEILHEPATPGKAVIDEAVELAKRYCDAESAGLVNGVLDRALREKAA